MKQYSREKIFEKSHYKDYISKAQKTKLLKTPSVIHHWGEGVVFSALSVDTCLFYLWALSGNSRHFKLLW